MPRPGPRTTYRYSDVFKATAVRLSQLPGVSVSDVAESLYIHPFMLSRWRKQAREGVIMSKGVEVDKAVAAELKSLREMKRQYERLKVEHDLLKKPSRSLRLERRRLRLHRPSPRNPLGEDDVPLVRRQRFRFLCLAASAGKSPRNRGCGVAGAYPRRACAKPSDLR
ncbi:transposase [Pseudoxanthomonas sp. UTMC 1351]|uniref:transposase n=1 Tax=Pseudoxanthomonas sp. UTMC 1351 TaxID=2695853 RepID=UPI0034CEED84